MRKRGGKYIHNNPDEEETLFTNVKCRNKVSNYMYHELYKYLHDDNINSQSFPFMLTKLQELLDTKLNMQKLTERYNECVQNEKNNKTQKKWWKLQ